MGRSAAAAVVLALLLTACSVVIELEPEALPPEDAPAGHEEVPEADPVPLGPAGDEAPLGSLGWALLSPEVPEAVLEVASGGQTPLPEAAVAALEDALAEHGGKTVTRTDGAELPAQDSYAAEDLLEFVLEQRTTSSGDGRVVVFVMSLPGRFEVEGVSGVAIAATAFAIFPDAIVGRLPPGAAEEAFVEATAIHELGHLFGLVNLTGEGAFHEDPESPGHSANPESVMHWAVETATAMELFTEGPPTTFTDDDLEEMARIREQRP